MRASLPRTMPILLALAVTGLLVGRTAASGQALDLLLDGGRVIDPKNGLSGTMDVGIVGGLIAEVAPDISADRAAVVVDVTGLYVTPGLIDLHTHVFWGTEPDSYLSNSYSSVPPDGFTFRSGVTTVVDVGGAGWRNFRQFKEQTIDRSRTRVLAFLNIVGSGMKGGAVEQDLGDMDPQADVHGGKAISRPRRWGEARPLPGA